MGEHTRGPLVKVVFIGAGNVATHLAPAIEKSGVGRVSQVYSRTRVSALSLCVRLTDAEAITEVSQLDTDADVYVVSLADHAAPTVIEAIKRDMDARMWSRRDALWLHTSGSLPVQVLDGLSGNTGVLYPLQTFSRNVEVEMSAVPMFVEGNNDATTACVENMAKSISVTVHYADGDLRRRMHIAAVFACNFTNYMFTVADDLLHADGLTLDVLRPLIGETVRKAMVTNPADGQTGPAVRGDKAVMERHIAMLPDDLAEMYTLLSEAIYNRHHRNEQD